MNTQYMVRLTATEGGVLDGLVHTGSGAARTRTHARSLRQADCGPDGPAWTAPAIRGALDVRMPTMERVRRTLVLAGFAAALPRTPPPPRPRNLAGRQAAPLIALAWRPPPRAIHAGRYACWPTRWWRWRTSMAGARDRAPTAAHNVLTPLGTQEWGVAPRAHAAVVAQMEDVLDG